jgi:hypothetical protein
MPKLVVPCEVFSRVVGYFRPVQNWNTGKHQEFREIVEFKEEVSLNTKVKLEAHGIEAS